MIRQIYFRGDFGFKGACPVDCNITEPLRGHTVSMYLDISLTSQINMFPSLLLVLLRSWA